MISIAYLIDLDEHPQVAYEGYDELREAARRRNSGFAVPGEAADMQEVVRRRGIDWCRSVLGHDTNGDLRFMSHTDGVMLLLADERGLEPPMPGWLVQWKEESAETGRLRNERREAGLRRDEDRWQEALAASGVPAAQLEVRPNVHTHVRRGERQALLHVVPLIDVRSARRRHPAGRELCAVRHMRELGEPVSDPATCVGCLKYTAGIQPAAQIATGGQQR